MIHIGIDNGTTGAIGVLGTEEPMLIPAKAYVRQYTGTKSGKGKELDPLAFARILREISTHGDIQFVTIERPFTGGPGTGNAAVVARGVYAGMQAVLEIMGIPYVTIDSREWQEPLFGKGGKAKDTKARSLALGIQRYPLLEQEIRRQGDADALFIAARSRFFA